MCGQWSLRKPYCPSFSLSFFLGIVLLKGLVCIPHFHTPHLSTLYRSPLPRSIQRHRHQDFIFLFPRTDYKINTPSVRPPWSTPSSLRPLSNLYLWLLQRPSQPDKNSKSPSHSSGKGLTRRRISNSSLRMISLIPLVSRPPNPSRSQQPWKVWNQLSRRSNCAINQVSTFMKQSRISDSCLTDNSLIVSQISSIGGGFCVFTGLNGSSTVVFGEETVDVVPPQVQIQGDCQSAWVCMTTMLSKAFTRFLSAWFGKGSNGVATFLFHWWLTWAKPTVHHVGLLACIYFTERIERVCDWKVEKFLSKCVPSRYPYFEWI